MKAGSLLRNRYRILAPIAEGGFGSVYRAEDTVLRRPCALKVNLQQAAIARQQFKSEASLLAGVHHQALPRVTDYFEEDDNQYLVMDYITGDDLQKKMGRVTEAEAVDWIVQVGRALAYLHQQTPPIYHRDIKPANIIVQGDGQAVLVDFGIAKAMESTELTQLGAKAVTAGYSPPEQYGGKTDGRSDVYALGATLYGLLMGRKPPVSVDRVQGATVQFDGMSKRLVAVIKKAMALNAAERYATMGQFVDALSAPDERHGATKRADGSGKKGGIGRNTLYFLIGITIGIALIGLLFFLLS